MTIGHVAKYRVCVSVRCEYHIRFNLMFSKLGHKFYWMKMKMRQKKEKEEENGTFCELHEAIWINAKKSTQTET